MTTTSHCHNCGSASLREFYEVRAIPAHSVLLMPTREKALSYPKRDLRLGFCDACGFVQNTIFDPDVHEYSPSYEETQGFSPKFREFARRIAQQYIDRYDLRHKRVLEIGCGKGEFLLLLCELGPNEGLGIDPSYVPERLSSDAMDRVRFIQELYSPAHAALDADFICCRHTLEHIERTKEFVSLVRGAAERNPATVVSFELPDVSRVLDEQAFWDIYYEHCSYYSPGSLARLFRGLGFEILDLFLDFDDQYIILDARLARPGAAGQRFDAEADLKRLRRSVESFEREVPGRIDGWRTMLREAHGRSEKTVLWGSGSKAVAFLTTLGVGAEVAAVTDINPYRHGKFMPGSGHEIVPPAALKTLRPDNVIVMNPIYCDEIGADLKAMGLEPRLLPL